MVNIPANEWFVRHRNVVYSNPSGLPVRRGAIGRSRGVIRHCATCARRLGSAHQSQSKSINMKNLLGSSKSTICFFLAALSLFLAGAAFAQPPSGDAIIGKWEADDQSVKLEMYNAGSELQARLLYGNEVVESDHVTFKNDVKNPNPDLRSRSLKNIVFISGLHWEGGEWSGGSLYDGSSGRTYKCNVQIKDGKMYLRGYLGISVLGQTKAFHRLHE